MLQVSSEEPESKYIRFADEIVESILMSKGISSDGVGITKKDAEAVLKIPRNFFEKNSAITSFDELVYFKNAQIDEFAFFECANLSSLDFSNVANIYEATCLSCTNLQNVKGLKNAYSIGNHAFQNTAINGDLILDNATSIGWFAFANCIYLKRAYLKKTEIINGLYQEYLGCYGAFGNCINLTEIELPEIREIHDFAFWHTYALKKIFIGSKCASIGLGAFQGCRVDDFIIETAMPPSLQEYSLVDCTINNLYVPDGSVEAYKTAPYWSVYASSVRPLSEYQK